MSPDCQAVHLAYVATFSLLMATVSNSLLTEQPSAGIRCQKYHLGAPKQLPYTNGKYVYSLCVQGVLDRAGRGRLPILPVIKSKTLFQIRISDELFLSTSFHSLLAALSCHGGCSAELDEMQA